MLANRSPNRCQAPGGEPGRMLANRCPKSVPGTRWGARVDCRPGDGFDSAIGTKHIHAGHDVDFAGNKPCGHQ